MLHYIFFVIRLSIIVLFFLPDLTTSRLSANVHIRADSPNKTITTLIIFFRFDICSVGLQQNGKKKKKKY